MVRDTSHSGSREPSIPTTPIAATSQIAGCSECMAAAPTDREKRIILITDGGWGRGALGLGLDAALGRDLQQG